MRCVVTGAAGFIGSHLCQRLLGDGHEVVGVDNLITGQWANLDEFRNDCGFQFLEQDISEGLSVEGKVDVLFNFACPASPADFGPKALDILRVCSTGVLNGLSLAREHDAVFVQASTSECYGDPLEHPQKETYWGHVNPIGERSPYDEGKRFAEAMIMSHHRLYGMKTRLGRIFNTYGPRMRLGDGRVLPNFICQALNDEAITVYGDGCQTRSFCYVTDLVEGFIRLGKCDDVMPINIGSPDEITITQLAEEVVELTESKSVITQKPRPEDDPMLRRPDLGRAKTLLKWQPTTPRRSGLESTIEYFRTVLESGILEPNS